MPTTYKSPFASTFKSACNKGTSYNVAVNNIAKRNNKKPSVVWNSLWKAGLCHRQKFNGQWIYFPCDWNKKSTVTACKNTQQEMWQWFCEWCLMTGYCTPEKMWNNCGSQGTFMSYCRKYFNKQFTGMTTGVKNGRTKSKKSGTYTFPTSRTTSRAA